MGNGGGGLLFTTFLYELLVSTVAKMQVIALFMLVLSPGGQALL